MTDTPWEPSGSRPWRTSVTVAGLLLTVGIVALVLRPGQQLPGDPLPIIEASDSTEPSQPSQPPVSPSPDPVGRWTPMAPAPFQPTQPSAGVWSGDELLVWDHSDTRLVWAYDPSTDAWRSSADQAPQDRGGEYGITFADGSLVIAGGSDLDGLPTAQAMIYDVDADAWTALPDMPLRGRIQPGMAASTDTVVVWGGQPLAASEPQAVGATLDLRTRRWNELGDMDLDIRPAPAVGLTPAGDVAVWGGTAGNSWVTDGAVLAADGTVDRRSPSSRELRQPTVGDLA